MGSASEPLVRLSLLLILTVPAGAAPVPATVRSFIAAQCAGCHNSRLKQGNLDLESLPFNLSQAGNFAIWAKIHDRVRDGECRRFARPL